MVINSKIEKWLEERGIQHPSANSYIDQEIVGKIDTCINNHTWLPIIRFLFNQFTKGLITDKQFQKLQDINLYTTKNQFVKAKICYLSDEYLPELSLEQTKFEGHYVSKLYIQKNDKVSEWNTFFQRIGVSQNIEIKHFGWVNKIDFNDIFIDLKYFDGGVIKAKSMPNYQGYRITGINNMHVLSYLKLSTQYEFSKIFWKHVSTKYEPKDFNIQPSLDMGTYNGYCYLDNYNKWAFLNLSILPTTTGKCLKMSEVLINESKITELVGDFLPVFDCEKPLSVEWRNFFKFKELTIEDYLFVLKRIADLSKWGEPISNSNFKRIGTIYNILAELLPNISEYNKSYIADWASKNTLLATNGKFESPIELHWLKGFSYTSKSENFKLIELPSFCKTESKNFSELLELFKVSVIAEEQFILKAINPVPDDSFKEKLIRLLPYYVFLVDRTHRISFSKELDWMLSVLIQTLFLKAEIKVSISIDSEIIEGPNLNVYYSEKDQSIYFNGDWRKPLIRYNIVPAIVSLLGSYGLNKELSLLLELEEVEIENWFKMQGYDIKSIELTTNYINYIPVNKEPPKVISTLVTNIPRPTFTPIPVSQTNIVTINPANETIEIPEEPNEGFIIPDEEVRVKIGKWSEEAVYKYLKDLNIYSMITWVNEKEESRLPYDFCVIENGEEKYIEVKGTPSSNKDLFYLSINEWHLMAKQKENYSILRVYNSGKTNIQIRVFSNPFEQIEEGKIKIALIV